MSKITKQSKRARNSYWSSSSSDSDVKEFVGCSDCSTDYSTSLDIKSSHCKIDKCNSRNCYSPSSQSDEDESNSSNLSEDQKLISETIDKLQNNEDISISKEKSSEKPEQSPTLPFSSKKVLFIYLLFMII
jgi:hypothetical protein